MNDEEAMGAARMSGAAVAVYVMLGIAACAAPQGVPDATSDAGQGELADIPATLNNVQALVFEPACAGSGCHDSKTMAGMLDLSSADASYDSLLGTDGLGVPAANGIAAENRWLRVNPGRPELSFIYRKVDLPGLGEGSPMPVGPRQLTEPYMHLLHVWIEEGAKR